MGLIGIIPSVEKTFEIYGTIQDQDPIEGKLYYDPKDDRVYYYSKKEIRSNPNTGYFPIWDGKKKYISQFSKEKYFSKDVTRMDLDSMSNAINKDVAEEILYQQRKSSASDVLKPAISDGDNMFTQCVKGVISAKNITIIDLIDMAKPKLSEKIVESYYSALEKITFMRLDKWNIWIDSILHVNYVVEIFKNGKKMVEYSYPENTFDTGIVKYDDIINTQDDPFKKIVKLLMVMCNIRKGDLRSTEVDDYTINNMMTTINSNKPLSAQIFSRFIHTAGMICSLKLYENDTLIFEYKE